MVTAAVAMETAAALNHFNLATQDFFSNAEVVLTHSALGGIHRAPSTHFQLHKRMKELNSPVVGIV